MFTAAFTCLAGEGFENEKTAPKRGSFIIFGKWSGLGGRFF
jgi:hypothetical protein